MLFYFYNIINLVVSCASYLITRESYFSGLISARKFSFYTNIALFEFRFESDDVHLRFIILYEIDQLMDRRITSVFDL